MATFVAIKGNLYAKKFIELAPASPCPPQITCSDLGICSRSECSCYINYSECKGENCPCGCTASSCTNAALNKLYIAKTRVRQITLRNTTTDINEGELIGEYNGVFRDLSELSEDDCHLHYTRKICVEDYKFFVDAKILGNSFRFIRNSCKPTATARPLFASDGSFHIGMYLLGDLMTDMEVTLNWPYLEFKKIKCLLECGCATLNLVSQLITDVQGDPTCHILTKSQKRIRKNRQLAKNKHHLRYCCEQEDKILSLHKIREYVCQFYDPIQQNQPFVPLDVYLELDFEIPPPQPPSPTPTPTPTFTLQSEPPSPFIYATHVKEEPVKTSMFGMARDCSEVEAVRELPVVTYSDINLNHWEPQPHLRIKFSFDRAFSLPAIFADYNLKSLHLFDCYDLVKDDSIGTIARLTSLESLWITQANNILPSKINSLLSNLTSLVDINFEGTCSKLVNSLPNLVKFTQLTSLNVSRSSSQSLDSNWLSQITPTCVYVKRLELSRSKLDTSAIEMISTLPYLTHLNLSNTHPTQDIVNVMSLLNHLTYLDFSWNAHMVVTTKGEKKTLDYDLLPVLAHHTSLHTLLIGKMQFANNANMAPYADAQLGHICTHLPHLETLDLESWPISSYGMWQLTSLQSLQTLRLFHNRTGVYDLQQFCGFMRVRNVEVDSNGEEDVF